MLKVLQICNKAPYPANDGSSIAIYNMARGLLSAGASLRLLTINTKKNFKPDEEVPAGFRSQTSYRSVYRNTNVNLAGALINLFSAESYFVSRFRFKRFTSELRRALLENDYDIVQIEGLFMAVYIPVIRKYSQARVCLRAHNIEHVIWTRHIRQERNPVKKWYLSVQNARLRRFELKTFGDVDAVIPITEVDASAIRKLGCVKPVFTCITGIAPPQYARPPHIEEKKNTVFHFGSMDWLPNQEAVTWFLENCWEKVRSEVTGARLIIAGRGMPLNFFHVALPGVTIVEQVDDPIAFYHAHLVMVVPLWSGSGLRIKIVEGMASGKAIVSTSIGAEGIGCTPGQDILIADTADAFADAVVALLRDADLRQRIGRNAAALASSAFNNGIIVSRLVEFYRTLN